MWKRITRQPIAYLAIFAAIVLAGCPETANVDDSAPTVLGTLPPVTVEGVGKAVSVPLAGAFRAVEGEKLDYDAESSNTTVAAAEVTGATLTITSRSAGTAIITVTATDSKKRSATQYLSITVSVPSPTTTPTPTTPTQPTQPTTPKPQEDCKFSGSSFTITIIRNTNKPCTLPTGHSLLYSSSEGKVRIGKPAKNAPNVWTITALKKGRPVVKVINSDGNPAGEITVKVPNTSPQLKETPTSIPGIVAVKGDNLITLAMSTLHSQFQDVDDEDHEDGDAAAANDDLVLNYRVNHKPDALLIKTYDGFLLDKRKNGDIGLIDAVLLKKQEKELSIQVYAYDRSGDRSDNPVGVDFTVDTTPPGFDTAGGVRALTYNLVKTGNNYKKTDPIGNRIGVQHTIRLSVDNGGTAYDFYSDLVVSPGEVRSKTGASGDPDTNITTICDDLVWDSDDGDQGVGCWYATTSSTKVTPELLTDKTALGVTLDKSRTLSDASDPMITIGYYAVKEATVGKPLVRVKSKLLTVDIHRCVDVDDCP